ncbi:MAG: SPOR domain-containing protein [Pseudomonadota bacterium]
MAYPNRPFGPARFCAVALAAFVASTAQPLSADVKRGVDAWSAGDFDGAVNEWRLPAQNGDADALFNLAQAYRLGRGVTADISRARQLYAEAAQKGHVKAADNYGLLLFQQGEQQNAMPFIRAAADRGDPRAQYVLGLAHFNADYAEKNWVRAYALLTLAQGSGLPQATGALKQMDQYVPMEQRQQAQLLARDIEVEAGKRRAAELAALELASSQPQTAIATNSSAMRMPAVVPTPVAAPAASPVAVSAQSPAAAPVHVAQSDATLAPVRTSGPSSNANRSGAWGVQLGAFGVAENADRLWIKLANNPALAGTKKALVPGRGMTRLRAIGFYSRAEASRACEQLQAQGQACLVSKPNA